MGPRCPPHLTHVAELTRPQAVSRLRDLVRIVDDEAIAFGDALAPQDRRHLDLALECLVDVGPLTRKGASEHDGGLVEHLLGRHPKGIRRINFGGKRGLVRRRRDLLPRVQAKRVRRCTRVHHEGKLLHGRPVVRIVREACPHGKAHSHADDHERATHEQEGPDGQHGQPELPSPHERSTSLATCPSTMRQLRSNSASSAGSL